MARTPTNVVRHSALLLVATWARTIAHQPSDQQAMLRPLTALDERLKAPNLMSGEGAPGTLGFGGLGAPDKVQQGIEEGDEGGIEAVADGPSSPQRLLGSDLGELLHLTGGTLRRGSGRPCGSKKV